jgi:hypothetical protein
VHNLQTFLLSHSPYDSDSLNAIVTINDVLLLSFGMDEDELYDHLDEHRQERKRESSGRENSNLALPSIGQTN